jgi:hypothetical protein
MGVLLFPDTVIGQHSALSLFEWHGRHGGQTHVEVGFVEDLVPYVVRAKTLDDREQCGLIGDPDDNNGWNFVRI